MNTDICMRKNVEKEFRASGGEDKRLPTSLRNKKRISVDLDPNKEENLS